MSRILAIDYGKKRTGIAVSDPAKIIASALTTVQTNELMSFLEGYIEKENVDTIVIGEAKQMNNTDSESMVIIRPFFEKLTKRFPDCHVLLFDERFTSKMAFQAMIDGGLKQKARRDKAMVDMVSATILLQSYMESIQNKKA